MKRCKDCGAVNPTTDCDVTGFACVMVEIGSGNQAAQEHADATCRSKAQDNSSSNHHVASSLTSSPPVEQLREDCLDADDDALRPCPFCGARAEIVEVEETDNQGGYVVCCTGCAASTKVWFPLKDDVTRILRDEWNRRTSLSAVSQPYEQKIAKLKSELSAARASRRSQDAGSVEGEQLSHDEGK